MTFIQLSAIGLCEHCNTLLSMEGMPSEAMGAAWYCVACGRVLTEKSFGYENDKKRYWVSEAREWTIIRPAEDFLLGTWYVIAKVINDGYFLAK